MASASRPKSQPPARAKARQAKPEAAPSALAHVPAAGPSAIMRIAHELASWANSALGVAEGATEMTIAAARSLARSPREKAAVGKAGEFLRAAREAAGITVDELGTAVDLSEPTLIEEAEEGRAALPFDLILRLAGVLGRNDPISFALKLTRSYNPGNLEGARRSRGRQARRPGRPRARLRQPLPGERRRAPPHRRRLRACPEVRRLRPSTWPWAFMRRRRAAARNRPIREGDRLRGSPKRSGGASRGAAGGHGRAASGPEIALNVKNGGRKQASGRES